MCLPLLVLFLLCAPQRASDASATRDESLSRQVRNSAEASATRDESLSRQVRNSAEASATRDEALAAQARQNHLECTAQRAALFEQLSDDANAARIQRRALFNQVTEQGVEEQRHRQEINSSLSTINEHLNNAGGAADGATGGAVNVSRPLTELGASVPSPRHVRGSTSFSSPRVSSTAAAAQENAGPQQGGSSRFAAQKPPTSFSEMYRRVTRGGGRS